jgi:hypothetical protein
LLTAPVRIAIPVAVGRWLGAVGELNRCWCSSSTSSASLLMLFVVLAYWTPWSRLKSHDIAARPARGHVRYLGSPTLKVVGSLTWSV